MFSNDPGRKVTVMRVQHPARGRSRAKRGRGGDPERPSRHPDSRWLALPVLVLVAALAACGGGSGGGQSEAETVASTTTTARASKSVTDLVPPVSVIGTTAGAVLESSDPSCARPVSGTVRYRFVHDAAGTILVSLHAQGDLDAVLSTYVIQSGQQKLVRCEMTDTNGDAQFVFESHPPDGGSLTYMLFVGQRRNSSPGSYRLTVGVPRLPANDERAGAAAISTLPVKLRGTTLGATADLDDPACAADAGTVWYRIDPTASGRIVARFHAGGDLQASVCLVRKVRSQIRMIAAHGTGDSGDAAFNFQGKKDATYYLIVGQRMRSEPGPFSLTVLSPQPPPARPGQPLSANGGIGRLDPLQNPADAWAVTMERGSTYRFGVLTTNGACISTAVYAPGVRTFESDTPVAASSCGNLRFFTPGPDGGGIYSVLTKVNGGDEVTPYRLVVRKVEADDMGPGRLLASGERVSGRVSSADPLDLYRFDVPRTSDTRILVNAARDLGIKLEDATGKLVQTAERGTKLIRVLEPGTYFLALTGREAPAAYRARVLVRDLTTTTLTVNGAAEAQVEPGVTVQVVTTTEPLPDGGTTRVQADYFDIVSRTWVFRQAWDVAAGTSIPFDPGEFGEWRLRATFYGTDLASPSRSDYASVVVAPAL